MQKYIALLRGINVSGHKIIKMADLRALLSEVGLSNVTTYIQTGNIFLNAFIELPIYYTFVFKK